MTTGNGRLPNDVMPGCVTPLRDCDAIPVRGLVTMTEVYVRITSSQFHHMAEAEVSRENKETRPEGVQVDRRLPELTL